MGSRRGTAGVDHLDGPPLRDLYTPGEAFFHRRLASTHRRIEAALRAVVPPATTISAEPVSKDVAIVYAERSLRDGWTRPFGAYQPGDPYALREFSQHLHDIVQGELPTSDVLFRRAKRLHEALREVDQRAAPTSMGRSRRTSNHATAHRWNDGVGFRVTKGQRRCAVKIEVQPANPGAVDDMLRKTAWLRAWLARRPTIDALTRNGMSVAT